MVFGKLLPREGNFFELFNQHGQHIAEGASVPMSTTHTITGAIYGVGSVRSASSVRWGLAANILMAWIFTIPATAFIAAVFYGVSVWLF